MESLASSKIQNWLTWLLRGLLTLGFLILFARIVDLQIIRGKYYRSLSEENRIRRIAIAAPRGEILARGGEVIATNKLVRQRIIFDSNKGYLKSTDLEGAADDETITEWKRDYISGSAFAHITGYLGEVDEGELGKINPQCPEKGPRKIAGLVGRSGLEEMYECALSGIDGEELFEVDSMGRKIRTLGRKEPVKGEGVRTTIDFGLQNEVARIVEDSKDLPRSAKGSVIVSDPFGEILAVYSFPSYDPNIFIESDDPQEVSKILNNPSLPLFNRSISGLYHPGSTFKPILAVAALEEGKINKDFEFDDKGRITIQTEYGDFSFANWFFTQYGGTEGLIKLPRAIARSTDTFFYKVGELLGVDKLDEWADKFGLSQKTGIDLPGEAEGFIPTPKWKMQNIGERWFLGNTYHLSIGQGYIAVTPLELNQAISTIANDGNYCKAHLINSKEECRNLGIDKENIELVKSGMVGACSPGGTGFTFFDFKDKKGINVACKTGTAETENGDPHAWFVAFAPAYTEASAGKPSESQITVTVLVENGGEGSKVAGPIARGMFDYWFDNKRE